MAGPRVRPWLLLLLQPLSDLYLKWQMGCREVRVLQQAELVRVFQRALAGEIRLIVAFRHPYVDEPQLLGWLFLRGLARLARSSRLRLARRPHALFVHGYEVPRWSGPVVRWLLPRIGALPIHHTKMDRTGMARIRHAITDGDHPVALAPEGQVSYTSEAVLRLEPGTVRLGLDAAQALAERGRAQPVIVLPLSVHRRYDERTARPALLRLLRQIERFVGVQDAQGLCTTARLETAVENVIERSEALYRLEQDEAAIKPDVQIRLDAVVEAAVTSGERILGISRGSGTVIDRVYRIRQIGWDRIYVQHEPRRLSPLEQALADRTAGEAWYAMRHMELADFAWYFRAAPPTATAPFDLIAEYVQNLWDFANRLAGGAISGRRPLRPYRALIALGEPIDLSDRLDQYRLSRRETVKRTNDELRARFEACIREARLHA